MPVKTWVYFVFVMVQSMSAGFVLSRVIIPQPPRREAAQSCYSTHSHSIHPAFSVSQLDNNLTMDFFLFLLLIINIASPHPQTEGTSRLVSVNQRNSLTFPMWVFVILYLLLPLTCPSSPSTPSSPGTRVSACSALPCHQSCLSSTFRGSERGFETLTQRTEIQTHLWVSFHSEQE